jgi:uncharacterized repeat protein (TIGR01451 family)
MKQTCIWWLFAALFCHANICFSQDFSQNFETFAARTDYGTRFNFSFSAFNTSTATKISGTRSMLSGDLTNATTGQNVFFQTGWLLLTAADTLTFKHRVTAISAAPFLTIKLVGLDGALSAPILTHTYTGTTVITTILPINVVGWYKIRFIGNGSGGSSKLVVDDLTSNIDALEGGNSCFLSDMELTATTDKINYAIGESIFLTLKVKNNGVDLANNHVNSILIPAGFSVISNTPTNCTVNMSTLEMTIPTLALGATATVVIEMTAPSSGIFSADLTVFGFNNTDIRVEFDHISANNFSDVSFNIESALPIELSAFQVEKMENNTSKITWTTESECGARRFLVERADTRGIFTPISIQNISSNCLVKTKNYQFIDRNILIGQNYYRLRMEDWNGTSTISEVVFVNFEPTKKTTPIFATAVSSELEILNAADLFGDLRIFDAIGRVVFFGKMENYASPISVENWNSGIYFVQYHHENEIWNGRLLKN